MPRDLVAVVNEALKGRYVVEAVVGKGAAARVFRAHDATGQTVALKVLHPELLVSAVADRFLREIQLARDLDHPHIARLLDSGSADWLVYYVMEFIEGPTLREALAASGAMPQAQALALADDLLGALDYAHGLGLVHRDVKPDNIMISPRGGVLLDFGIARAVAATGANRLTLAGMTVGTAGYMSPEQVTAEPDLDHRSDIYSFGCVLYECLAGEAPYSGMSDALVMQRHVVGEPADLSRLRGDVSSNTRQVLQRALARQPEQRWQSAAEMREALRAQR